VPRTPGTSRPIEQASGRIALSCAASTYSRGIWWASLKRAIGAVVARFVHTEEVTGSNPVSPTQVSAIFAPSNWSNQPHCLTNCLSTPTRSRVRTGGP
jgi:hypothetical protein